LGEQIPNEVYHARFKRLLEDRYPNSIFSVINAGYGGWTAPGALANLERDVLRHQPDLVLVAFGLNDSGQGLAGTAIFADALRQIVTRVHEQTDSSVILLTSSFMNMADNPRVAQEHRDADLPAQFAKIQKGGTLAAYAEAVRQVARETKVPVADVYAEWERLAAGGTNTDDMLANGLNHPTAEAHAIPAQLLLQLVAESGFLK
jgi:lysophospholipase L1-like esterase